MYFEKATADRRGQREGGAGMTVTDSYDEMREHPREANERFAEMCLEVVGKRDDPFQHHVDGAFVLGVQMPRVGADAHDHLLDLLMLAPEPPDLTAELGEPVLHDRQHPSVLDRVVGVQVGAEMLAAHLELPGEVRDSQTAEQLFNVLCACGRRIEHLKPLAQGGDVAAQRRMRHQQLLHHLAAGDSSRLRLCHRRCSFATASRTAGATFSMMGRSADSSAGPLKV